MTTSPVPGIPGGAEISDEVVGRAVAAALNAGASSDPGACDITPYEMSAALAEVVPDLVRAERDRVRRQCAEELRTLATAWRGEAATYIAEQAQAVVSDAEELEKVAASWSTPDPGEPQEIARMEYPVTLAAAVGVPDPEHVRRCVVGDDQGRTTFYYDDGRDPWVLPGIQELQR